MSNNSSSCTPCLRSAFKNTSESTLNIENGDSFIRQLRLKLAAEFYITEQNKPGDKKIPGIACAKQSLTLADTLIKVEEEIYGTGEDV